MKVEGVAILGMALVILFLLLVSPLAAHRGPGPAIADSSPDAALGPIGIQAPNPNSPSQPVKLVFIHHSTGENWLADDNGGLSLALRDNNYFLSDTNYGWGTACPSCGGCDSAYIGSCTDIGHWWEWFRGPNSVTYTAALYAESGQTFTFSRLPSDPGGENKIVMFKSCFPNSSIAGNPTDPPTTGANPLRGQDSGSEYHTVANVKGIYNDLLPYFASRRDKLFILIVSPPVTDPTYSTNARAVAHWLVNDWLRGYPYNNMAVFDFYNVLTTNGGNPNTNDLGLETGNHHRWWQGAIQHKTDGDGDDNPNVLEYPTATEDDHPSRAGNQKATAEFAPLLNIFYHRWLAEATSKATFPTTARPGQEITYTIRLTSLPPTATIYLTDTVPSGLAYIPGSLAATAGTTDESASPTLHWSGILSPHIAITVTYAVTVATARSQTITNTALIAVAGDTFTCTTAVEVTASFIYLPAILKSYAPPVTPTSSQPSSGTPIARRWSEYATADFAGGRADVLLVGGSNSERPSAPGKK